MRPRYPRILITGCARSGNTLLLHLMGTGYRNTLICHGEQIPAASLCHPGVSVIGKKPGAIVKLDRVLAQPDIGVIFTVRDPRDCICSRHVAGDYWVKPERWVKCAEIIARHACHPGAAIVRFEQMLREPAVTQQWLASKFGLQIRRPWVQCYDEFDCRDSQGMAAMHGARPLDLARIGHWRHDPEHRERVAEAFRSTPELPRWMEEFGYVDRQIASALPLAAEHAAVSREAIA